MKKEDVNLKNRVHILERKTVVVDDMFHSIVQAEWECDKRNKKK